jgi:Sigma-70 region 2
MDDTGRTSGSPDTPWSEMRADPQVRAYALKLADGDRDVAEDLLQAASAGLAARKHDEPIENSRAYFMRVVRNQANKLYRPQREILHANPEDALDFGQPGAAMYGPVPSRLIDDQVGLSMQAQIWLKRLLAQCDELLADIPGRSLHPARYRAVIYQAAELVLRDGLNGEPSDADSSDALIAAYPEYFSQPGAQPNTLYQRFRRAREDVKALLQAIVPRDELF